MNEEENIQRGSIQHEQSIIHPQEADKSPTGTIVPAFLPIAFSHLAPYQHGRLKKNLKAEGSREKGTNNSQQEQTDKSTESWLRTDAKRSIEQSLQEGNEQKAARGPIRTLEPGTSIVAPQRHNRNKSSTPKRDLKRKRRRKVQSKKIVQLRPKTAVKRLGAGRSVRESVVKTCKKKNIKRGKSCEWKVLIKKPAKKIGITVNIASK